MSNSLTPHSRPADGRAALERLRAVAASGTPILGGGAGTGLSAAGLDAGGADLLVVYNSGRFRMAGRGSLAGLMPYGNANDIVREMVREVLPVVRRAAVLAGVCATDPFRDIPLFLRELRDMGVVGVQNFPTVGLIDGTFRANLEETGMGYAHEVALVRAARALGLLATPYVFDAAQAHDMAEAGADVLVAHMGLTTSGAIGAATAKSLDDCVALTQAIADAAHAVSPDALVLVHGGPVATPEDAQYVLTRTRGVVGFYGASALERLPVETALRETAERFKALALGPQRD